MKKAAATIYGWDYPLLPFIFSGLIVAHSPFKGLPYQVPCELAGGQYIHD